ncbi:lysophospholipid acyltransferase family protein [Tropicimonas sp. IMCC34011]|uniref:lysophospholipid acyltransferase family protein n=1 Tax=Tropicimonas sp. IMCC34011 TaxID=2248759 RepID=UPI000E23A99D|nr:DUF374 domain-containing protein [Tropicimonas sp. IMCC34011]
MAKRRPTWIRRKAEALADSRAVLGSAEALIARRLRRAHARTDWTLEGWDALHEAATAGPVIFAVWHGRLAMTPWMWDRSWGPIWSVTSHQRPGRIVGGVLGRFGWDTVRMHDTRRNDRGTLTLARAARAGASFGIACDGPVGPARRMSSVAVDWARVTGAPIFMWSYSVERYSTLPSWDRLIVPKPGGAGRMVWKRWGEIGRRTDPAEMEVLRARLEADLDELTDGTDRAMGHAGPIDRA